MAKITPSPGIKQLAQTEWTKPEFVLPVPSLTFLFHLECDMHESLDMGSGPFGERSAVIFTGGRFEGPRLRGTILPGGGDWRIIRRSIDPVTGEELSTAYLDTRYNLQTHDGAMLYLQTTGTRTGPVSVLAAMQKGDVDPSTYRMRLSIKIETGDERYEWLNRCVVIASAGRPGNQVIYDAYVVE